MRHAIAGLFVAVACGASMPAAGFGQERVRLTLPRDTLVGEVIRMSAEELELSLGPGRSRVFPRDEVLRMERGIERSQGHVGFLLGAVLGYGGGIALLFASDDPDLWPVTPIGLVVGGLAGYGIGAAKKVVRWEIVPAWTVDWMMPFRGGNTGLPRDLRGGLRVGIEVGFR